MAGLDRVEAAPINDAEILALLVSERRSVVAAERAALAAQLPAAAALQRLRGSSDGGSGSASGDGQGMDTATHTAFRKADAAARTEALDALVERLRTLTAEIVPVSLNFDVARSSVDALAFDAAGLDQPEPEPELTLPSPPPGLLARVMPSSRVRHDEAVAKAELAHEAALRDHAERQRQRSTMLADAMAAHERAVAGIEATASVRNRKVDALRTRIEDGEPAALAAWFAAILAASDYPPGFPQKATLAFDGANRFLVVDYELPTLEAIPSAQAVRYDASSDTFEDVPRPASRRKDLYTVVVASTALRSVRELFDADHTRLLDSIAFNGYVHGVDRVSGEPVRPHLVSFRTTREEFRMLEITRTDPIVSMRSLEAAFSNNPADLAAVREVVGVRSLGPGAALASTPH